MAGVSSCESVLVIVVRLIFLLFVVVARKISNFQINKRFAWTIRLNSAMSSLSRIPPTLISPRIK